jgi:uncharacterized protein YbjT (DUF2867 family)
MKVVIFGASGMVGQGVLRECLADAGVERVLAVVRSPLGSAHEKLDEIVHRDFFDFTTLEPKFAGQDACFFSLGVSSAGMTEEAYRRATYDIALSAARSLVRASPGMTFIYVSGAGTDSTESGKTMWARVKGSTENALRALPFRHACMFRPGIIVPLHGIRSKTRVYRIFYAIFRPILPAAEALFPGHVTTTGQVGRAMIAVARNGPPKPILESRDIRALGGG